MQPRSTITIFLCGDVMTGRGIDQIFLHPSDPRVFEPYVSDARRYVELAEEMNGPIPRSVGSSYIWGEALDILTRMKPDARIVNLETSITTSGDYWPGKGINYRMEPRNVDCLTAAGIDVCALANNHVLDWGYAGLVETLRILETAGVKGCGAGKDLNEAEAPAVVEVAGEGGLLVFSFGVSTSGIPHEWAASPGAAGVNLLPDLSAAAAHGIKMLVQGVKRPGDLVVASIHWGGNWGYTIPWEQTEFAHTLIDDAGIDVIHGHSSHHVKGVEIHGGKPIIYGCGDFINDYEGIGGNERYRGELGLMYFVEMEPASGKLVSMRMKPTRMRNFRLRRASNADAEWLCDTLNREGYRLGSRVELDKDNSLILSGE